MQMSNGFALEFGTPVWCRRVRGSTPLCDVARWLPPGFCPGHFPNRKARILLQCFGFGESCEAAVGVGISARRPLPAILIELQSSGLVSPAGRARRFPGGVAFGSEGGVLWAAEVATRGRFGSASTQPRMRRIESTRSGRHRLSKKTPPHATITHPRPLRGAILTRRFPSEPCTATAANAANRKHPSRDPLALLQTTLNPAPPAAA